MVRLPWRSSNLTLSERTCDWLDLGNDHRSSLDEEISNHSSQPQLPSVPATQQQEAYCNLCERSFCNKYFLKTHLAKKHGVLNMVSPLSSADNHDNGHVAFSPPVSSSSCLSTESTSSTFDRSATNTSDGAEKPGEIRRRLLRGASERRERERNGRESAFVFI